MYTVLQRDRRLTGYARGQTDKPEAPKGFELNNPWRVSARGRGNVCSANNMQLEKRYV